MVEIGGILEDPETALECLTLYGNYHRSSLLFFKERFYSPPCAYCKVSPVFFEITVRPLPPSLPFPLFFSLFSLSPLDSPSLSTVCLHNHVGSRGPTLLLPQKSPGITAFLVFTQRFTRPDKNNDNLGHFFPFLLPQLTSFLSPITA